MPVYLGNSEFSVPRGSLVTHARSRPRVNSLACALASAFARCPPLPSLPIRQTFCMLCVPLSEFLPSSKSCSNPKDSSKVSRCSSGGDGHVAGSSGFPVSTQPLSPAICFACSHAGASDPAAPRLRLRYLPGTCWRPQVHTQHVMKISRSAFVVDFRMICFPSFTGA